MYKGTLIRLKADFFSRMFAGQKRVAWCIQSAEGKNFQPRILQWAKLSFRLGESFLDKEKLEEYVNTKPALQNMLKKPP